MLNKKQLNRCQAWTYYDGKTIADSEYVALRSYNTLIAVWKRSSRTLFLGPHWSYSPTTVQHTYKWLRQMGFGISGYDVRYWVTKCVNPYTGEIINADCYREHYGYDALIFPVYSNELFALNRFVTYKLEQVFNGDSTYGLVG